MAGSPTNGQLVTILGASAEPVTPQVVNRIQQNIQAALNGINQNQNQTSSSITDIQNQIQNILETIAGLTMSSIIVNRNIGLNPSTGGSYTVPSNGYAEITVIAVGSGVTIQMPGGGSPVSLAANETYYLGPGTALTCNAGTVQGVEFINGS